MTKETMEYIKKPYEVKPGEGYGICMGQWLTSICGVVGLFFSTKDGVMAVNCKKVHGGPLGEIMSGYGKVTCPKCIEILKANGL